MSKKFIISLILVITWFLHFTVYSQEYEAGVFRVWLVNDNIRFNDNKSNNNELNIIMAKYGVTSIEQSFPWANKPENRRFYTIRFTGDDLAFINEINEKASHIIHSPYRFEISTPLYAPSDVLYDSIWHLKKIQADSA